VGVNSPPKRDKGGYEIARLGTPARNGVLSSEGAKCLPGWGGRKAGRATAGSANRRGVGGLLDDSLP
jgi:hypothetical protein